MIGASSKVGAGDGATCAYRSQLWAGDEQREGRAETADYGCDGGKGAEAV
jgi:hypothetical protein